MGGGREGRYRGGGRKGWERKGENVISEKRCWLHIYIFTTITLCVNGLH